ncbi:distal tail protein Dit [Fructilactobacillus sp. Tb1]|uniref:distal tail protein Dit n=1 Tax=Fructilactobacillus sp. Tb1 TaxID=3422304 RepID=UPI003D276FCA
MYLHNSNNFIENLISGYQTLTVDGRGMLGYKLNANEINGGDGQMYLGATLPPREIEIEYVIDAQTPEQFIEKLDLLTNLLLDKQFWFSFKDDPNWYYQGTISDFIPPDKGALFAKGSFTITCSDPFKYGIAKQSNGTVELKNKAKIVEIDFTPQADVGKFTLTNDLNQAMIIDGTVKLGDTIKIFPQEPLIMLNGTIHTEWFGYSSDIEDFAMTNNIKTSISGNLNITYREVRL